MTLDVLYPAFNRLEFTRFSFDMLIRNTNWSLVRRLVVYDDSSVDGTREFLLEALDSVQPLIDGAEVSFVSHRLRSPVAVMNSYLADYHADVFAKVDSDVVVPPGWLDEMVSVMERHPSLELLGMEADWCGLDDSMVDHTVELSTHIGGVGLMRSSAFDRGGLQENGRFGFTEWQHNNLPKRGFIRPDLLVATLDRVPCEPWMSLSKRYVANEWQREWPLYDVSRPQYWDWFTSSVTE